MSVAETSDLYELELVGLGEQNAALLDAERRGDQQMVCQLYPDFLSACRRFKDQFGVEFIAAVPRRTRIANPPAGWLHGLNLMSTS